MEATSQLKHSENVDNQQKNLLEQNATSVAKFEESKTSYHAAQTRLEMYMAKRDKLFMQKERQKIVAPIDGKILVIYRQKGSYVNSDMTLTLIGEFSTLYFSTPINDEDAR